MSTIRTRRQAAKRSREARQGIEMALREKHRIPEAYRFDGKWNGSHWFSFCDSTIVVRLDGTCEETHMAYDGRYGHRLVTAPWTNERHNVSEPEQLPDEPMYEWERED